MHYTQCAHLRAVQMGDIWFAAHALFSSATLYCSPDPLLGVLYT